MARERAREAAAALQALRKGEDRRKKKHSSLNHLPAAQKRTTTTTTTTTKKKKKKQTVRSAVYQELLQRAMASQTGTPEWRSRAMGGRRRSERRRGETLEKKDSEAKKLRRGKAEP
jgi:hypothetical protein